MSAELDQVDYLTDFLLECAAEYSEEMQLSAVDVLKAQINVLDTILRGVRKLQDPKDRFSNAKIVQDALTDLLIEFGRVPS